VEIFVDCGLFELFLFTGISLLSRGIYSRKALATAFLLLSVISPAAVLVLSSAPSQRWAAGLSLTTALVNAAVVAAVLQAGTVPHLRLPRWHRSKREAPRGEGGVDCRADN
jgi:hypothetical protein